MESANHGNTKDLSKIRTYDGFIYIYISFDKPKTIVVYITGIRKNRQMDEQSG